MPLDCERLLYRWDLDKTYLRTEFDTLRDIVRIALEKASDKQTVPGASTLLKEVQATKPAGVHILSGSPEQMRKVLEAKLKLDGIQWDRFTLKPSLSHLVRGRLRFVRDQYSYKLGALLQLRTTMEPDAREILFGDDAEADAFIYSLYADISAGRVGNETLMTVLRRARVYESQIPDLVRLAGRIPRGDLVHRIFIHLDRMSSPDTFAEFGRRVCPFYNYFQPALVLVEEGALPNDAALRIGIDLISRHGFPVDSLAASFFELAGRGHVGRAAATALIAALESIEPPPAPAAARGLDLLASELKRRLGELNDPGPIDEIAIDYVGLFSRDRARSRAARQRAKERPFL